MFRSPAAVFSKRVHENATYDDVVAWWHSDDHVATAGRSAVKQGAVCFVQLGGSDQVFVSVPPEGRWRIRSCSKRRGTVGTALLLTYV